VKALATLMGLMIVMLGSSAQAHIASNGFLVAEVSGEDIKGSIELAVRDVELAIGVDRDNDGNITWGELRASTPQLRQYVAERLQFAAQGRGCTLSFQALQVNDRVDGSYSWLPWTARCSAPIRQLSVSYALMQGVDPSHRGLLTLKAGGAVQTAVLGGAAAPLNFDIANPSRWRTFTEYLQAGISHIWGGIDHLLFLLSLLLPAVLLRQNGHWRAQPCARPAFLSILKVVTAFTLAHSITSVAGGV
jgi:hypothetical protein